MTVKLHDYGDTLELPLGVSELIKTLDNLVPEPCSCQAVPRMANAQVESFWDELCKRTPQKESSAKLRSALDSIIAISTGIEALTSIEDDYGPRHTRPLWHTFIRTLGRVCYENSATM